MWSHVAVIITVTLSLQRPQAPYGHRGASGSPHPLHRVEYTNSLCLMPCRMALFNTDLRQMKGVTDDIVTFNSLIQVLGRFGTYNRLSL